jgi:poly(ADP-ribose) glycohydrolase
MGYKRRKGPDDRFRNFIDDRASDRDLKTNLGFGNLEFNSNELNRILENKSLRERRRILHNLMRRNWICAFDPEVITDILPTDIQCKYMFEHFPTRVLNWMAISAMHLTENFPEGLPRLQIGRTMTLNLTKSSVCNILSAIFLGATPLSHRFLSRYAIEHTSLKNKLCCILNYFYTMFTRESVRTEPIDHFLSYTRISAQPRSLSDWLNSTAILSDFYYHEEGCIEDFQAPCLVVDFANKFIGGGTMRMGCVQEEIMFVEHPECIVSMLMCDKLEDNEAVVIVGAERFSRHSGYGKEFKYAGPYPDGRRIDDYGRLDHHIVAIDALVFKKRGKEQFDEVNILRELNKAWIGFKGDPQEQHDFHRGKIPQLRPICTGKWGCGVFGGDPQLKALLQWAAASENSRGIVFMGFKDRSLSGLPSVISKYSNMPVRVLISDILSVCPSVINYNKPLFNELLK